MRASRQQQKRLLGLLLRKSRAAIKDAKNATGLTRHVHGGIGQIVPHACKAVGQLILQLFDSTADLFQALKATKCSAGSQSPS
eukprot:COSAG06_NODE_1010_length_11086_cov_3.749613_5_plen_83_part_00